MSRRTNRTVSRSFLGSGILALIIAGLACGPNEEGIAVRDAHIERAAKDTPISVSGDHEGEGGAPIEEKGHEHGQEHAQDHDQEIAH